MKWLCSFVWVPVVGLVWVAVVGLVCMGGSGWPCVGGSGWPCVGRSGWPCVHGWQRLALCGWQRLALCAWVAAPQLSVAVTASCLTCVMYMSPVPPHFECWCCRLSTDCCSLLMLIVIGQLHL